MQQAAITAVRLNVLGRYSRLLIPSLSDCLFAALLIWVFATGAGWKVLLADGDTGWHIRTGDYILDNRSVPHGDLFSFTKPGQTWYAWEWLADGAYALANRTASLKGVVLLAGLVISLSCTILFRHMMWRGVNVFLALGLTLMASTSASLHFLARPHVFSFLLFVISLWLIDRDRRWPNRNIWWLVPIAAIWANAHGGFLALIASLGLCWIGAVLGALFGNVGPGWQRVRRYTLLTGACSAATLLNPFGIRLHMHIAQYLQSNWIRDHIAEFLSPQFRDETLFQFEILLFAGVVIVALLLQQRRFEEALLILFWGHASLGSVRHVPLFALVTVPILGVELNHLWKRWSESKSRTSLAGIVRDLAEDFSRAPMRTSIWAPVLVIVLMLLNAPLQNWPTDFPDNKFPVKAVNRNLALLAPAEAEMPRVLTSDQWADYLIYRFYPREKVFFDGRSDFYGPSIGDEYVRLQSPRHDWAELLDKYRFDVALLPIDWPLAELLKADRRWRVRHDDGVAIVFERVQRLALMKAAASAESIEQTPKGVPKG